MTSCNDISRQLERNEILSGPTLLAEADLLLLLVNGVGVCA